MKLSAWKEICALSGGLLLTTSLAAKTEYQVAIIAQFDLKKSLDYLAEYGWELRFVNIWTDNCPDGKPECLIVILEKK